MVWLFSNRKQTDLQSELCLYYSTWQNALLIAAFYNSSFFKYHALKKLLSCKADIKHENNTSCQDRRNKAQYYTEHMRRKKVTRGQTFFYLIAYFRKKKNCFFFLVVDTTAAIFGVNPPNFLKVLTKKNVCQLESYTVEWCILIKKKSWNF